MPEPEIKTDEIPSELRSHIKAEQLRPEAQIFERSAWSVCRYLLLPFLFIIATVLIARLQLFSPVSLLLFSFPFLLAAQRCFQTLVHDLSHKLISTDMARNDKLGDYLVAGWSGVSVPAYRAVHLQHHKFNGSKQDPEHISYALIQQRGGLWLHCIRYILGLEALRLVNKYYGPKPESSPQQSKNLKASKTHIFVCQIALLVLFSFVAGAWYLYLLWLYLAVTWNPLLSNLRFLVEHPGESDLTVSTRANWLERLYFAPFNFNYHLEHHLWPNLPPYRLAMAHQYLNQQEYFDRHPEFLGKGFVSSLRKRS